MPNRPSPAQVLRARREGLCPWCGYSTENLTGDLCPECGNNARLAAGPPDPGTRSLSRLGMIFTIVLIACVALSQQLGGSAFSPPPPNAAEIEPPSAQFEVTAKVFVKVYRAFPSPELEKSAVKSVHDQAHELVDQIRAAIVAGEIQGGIEALSRLSNIESGLAPDSPLMPDVAALRAIYENAPPDDAARARLNKHHAWFGELAAVYGVPDNDPDRERVIGGGGMFLVLAGIVGVGVILAMIAGFTLLIVALVRGAGGKLQTAFIPPTPGGSLAIEMVAVFVLGFLILKGATALMEGALSPRDALWIGLIAQWGLLAVVLWPKFRGAPKGRGMSLMGWHKGAGVLTEVGCGFVGYLACLPLMLMGAVVSIILVLIHAAIQQAVTGQAPASPQNPVLEIASGKAGVVVVVMVCLLASLWAPIVEETIFRGCLYRHLRARWHWLAAGAFTAFCFGLMHGYPILMLGPVISLGFGFALLREWRGSLIAPMTAHCIHNATVLGLLLVAMRLLNG